MTKSQKTTVAVLIAGAFLSVLNQTLMNPALPSVMEELRISAATAQWLVSGFTLVNAIAVAVSAFLMDRFRIKQLFISSFVLFFAGSLLAAWGISFPVLLAGRFLQAMCAGIMIPMSLTTLLLIFPTEKRGSAMGMFSFVIMFAPSIGPAISGILTDKVGWHVTFGIMAVLAGIIIFVAAVAMKDLGNTKKVRLDKLSLLLCTTGLFSLLYGFSVLDQTDTLVAGGGMIVLGGILLVFFSKRQFKLENPFLQIGVLQDRQFRTGTIILMLMSASLTAAIITLPIYVQIVRGMSATTSGVIMMPGAILGAIAGYFSGRLSDKIGARPLAIVGIILVIVGSAGMSLWNFNTPVAALIVIYCIRYIGLMLANTPINLWSIRKLSNEMLNHGNAVSNTMRQVASTLGTAVMVSVMSLVANISSSSAPDKAQMFGIQITFYLSAAIAVVSLVMVLVSVRNSGRTDTVKTEMTELDAVMNANPPTVYVSDTLGRAVRVFVENRTSGLPVIDEEGNFAGYLTDGDIVRFLASQHVKLIDANFIDINFMMVLPDHKEIVATAEPLLRKNVMEAANKHAVTVEHDVPLAYVCKLFHDKRLNKIPVTRDGIFVGTISRIDVLHFLMRQLPINE